MRKFSRRSRQPLEGLLWSSLTQLLCFLWLKEQAGIQALEKQTPFLNGKEVYVYMQLTRNVWGRWRVCLWVYMYAYVYKGQRAISNVIPRTMTILFIEAWSVSHLGLAKYARLAKPVSPRYPCTSDFPEMELQEHAITSGFLNMGLGELNLGPHACTARGKPTEPSLCHLRRLTQSPSNHMSFHVQNLLSLPHKTSEERRT